MLTVQSRPDRRVVNKSGRTLMTAAHVARRVYENHVSPLVSISVLSPPVQRATDQTSVPGNL